MLGIWAEFLIWSNYAFGGLQYDKILIKFEGLRFGRNFEVNVGSLA
jgi:hypothetical protein